MSDNLAALLDAAVALEASLRRRGWRFCFIGGVAVQRWGNPRFTRDLDITLLTGFGGEAQFIDALLEDLQPRRDDGRAFALRHRVLLARTSTGVDVDVALGALPFEARTVERATFWRISDTAALTTCSCEDLLVHKVFAGRDQDWADVEQILIRQHGRIDLTLIRDELGPLLSLKEDTDAAPKLERLVRLVERRLSAEP